MGPDGSREMAYARTVTREQVWKVVAETLRPQFGSFLDIRDVRRVRRVAGDGWTASVVLATSSGDLHVVDLLVDDTGAMSPVVTAELVVEAIRRPVEVRRASELPDELADFGAADAAEDDFGLLEELEQGGPESSIEARIERAIAAGDPSSLRTARDLLPRLLTDHDRQGATLLTMAEVEIKLGDTAPARGYLEAAAREFADRFDLPALERAAGIALQLSGRDAFAGSAVHTLLEQSRSRLRPLHHLADARTFWDVSPRVLEKILTTATLRTLAPAETLVSEGEPSRNVFVVKSGLLGVWLEKPSGGSWLVRSCFPGWLLGESSVLGDGTAVCTATLRAERVAEVWCIPAATMRAAMDVEPTLGERIAQTKQTHRIDSFFSMHETMGQLDVQVRDDVLSCIQRLETFEEETIVMLANEIPTVACLVARGALMLVEDGNDDGPVATIHPASFYGVRDAIHRIAPPVSAVARAGSTVAFFDAVRLQKLCERSPEQVVAVLERLG